MRLAHISDCHLFADKAQSAYQVNPYQSLCRVLAQVASETPDGLLITGDISGDNSAQSYEHFHGAIAHYLPACPWRVIAGNHDNNPHFQSAFSHHYIQAGEPWTLGDWCVHGMDTRFQGARGQILIHELTALEKRIEESKSAFHILALHHHIQPSNSWMDKHSLENPDDLLAWLEQSQNIAFALHGHIHAERQTQVGVMPVYAVPSTCWQWQLSPEFAVAEEAAGYRIFDLMPNGKWTSSVRRVV